VAEGRGHPPGQPARAGRRHARGRRHRGNDDSGGLKRRCSGLTRRRSARSSRSAPSKELPLNGRNFATLVYLTPGITPGQAGENLSGASTFNPRGASNFNALGHQANANGWLIDGIDNNEYTFNTVIIAPSVEQVREFKVLSGVFSAEFGRGAGVVSVATKSGSNTLHGTVFEYLRNDAFDAETSSCGRCAGRRQLPRIRSRRSIGISSAPRSAGRW
jgi:hypothetical protein